MKKIFLSMAISFCIAMLHFSGGSAEANAVNGGPPFKAGQVVVAGSPGPHLGGLEVLKYLPHSDLTVVAVEKGYELGMVQRFRNRGRRASLNYIARASAAPNDPFYSPYQWNFNAVQSEGAWELSAGYGVTVAVLDTGLAVGGEDGINCVESPFDVVNNDNDPEDGSGHGTHVAGTIAQASGNGIGAAGLAYDACIMPVKVLDDSGAGAFADIAEGVYYAVDNGADVINMSLGTNARFAIRTNEIMDPALDYAHSMGVVVVCASGNDASKKNVSYPAIYPTTIGVGATDYNNTVTRYSNKGEGLDLVAPGGDMAKDLNGDGYADGILQETMIQGAWGYYFFEGTSMASPHAASAAAMLLSADASLTPEEVYSALTQTALDLEDAGYDKVSGYGLIRIFNALTGEGQGAEPGTDQDGDGWTVEDGDCDDNDPEIFPGHQDVRGKWGRDGVDNDCNGVIDG